MNLSRNKNPYAGIDWEAVNRISGCTHMHCLSAETLKMYLDAGLDFATFSNYYPSVPWYPLASLREKFFRVRQTGYVRDGEWQQGELDINAAIQSWKEKLQKDRYNSEKPHRLCSSRSQGGKCM